MGHHLVVVGCYRRRGRGPGNTRLCGLGGPVPVGQDLSTPGSRLLLSSYYAIRNRGCRDPCRRPDRASSNLSPSLVEVRACCGSGRSLGCGGVPFEWGSEERLSFDLPLPFSPLQQASDTCREQYPAAAEEAFARWRVPDECRTIWLNTATTTTTTTLPPIQTRRAELRDDLDAKDWAALEALGDAYDILARALDNNEQTAILAFVAARNSGNQDLEDTAGEVMASMLDDLDRTAIQLVYDARGRLREQLDSKQHSAATCVTAPSGRLTPGGLSTATCPLPSPCRPTSTRSSTQWA